MYKFTFTAGLCLIIIGLASSCRLVCFYNREAKNREADGRFLVSDIDPNLCTHVIYASADINSTNQLAPLNESDLQDYMMLNRLKQRNPQLKTLLSVGGMNFDNRKFRMAANNVTFLMSAVALLREFNFDGINVDWRFPGGPGSEQLDRARFSLLVKDLGETFVEEVTGNNSRLLVTASVSAERAIINASYDIEQIAVDLDFINVMTFDFRGPWENVTGHHSPLFNGSQDTGDKIFSNTNSAMQFWRDQGAPPEKLNVGIAAFGRAFNLSTANSDVGAPANGPGEEGCYTGEEGFWAYYEICLYLAGVEIQLIPDQGVPFATTENQWVGFDNLTSLENKANYTIANNFGGVFVWSLDLDDFTGQFCNMGNNSFIAHLRTLLPPGACTNVTATVIPAAVRSSIPVTILTTASSSERAAFETLPPTTIMTTAPPAPPAPPAPTSDESVAAVDICRGATSTHIADPTNSTRFYQCAGDRAFLRMCSIGLVFKQSCTCCDFDN